MPRFKRTIPPFNATSSADIAFILLLFFLLSGSLSSNTGIYRQLLPNTKDQLKKKIDIEKRNFITFSIDGNNMVFMEDDPIKLHEIRDMAKTFIANPNNSDYLPEKQEINIPELGLVAVTPHAVINMEISRMSSYQTYISVLGELSAAYDELRNELANERFNKSFEHLSKERQLAIREAIPLRIAEKESERKEDANEQIP